MSIEKMIRKSKKLRRIGTVNLPATTGVTAKPKGFGFAESRLIHQMASIGGWDVGVGWKPTPN
jgi:hypothetical protein